MLVLALVFLVAIGVAVGAIATLAMSAATTTYNSYTERSSETSAEAALTAAIATVRSNYTYTCWTPSSSASCITKYANSGDVAPTPVACGATNVGPTVVGGTSLVTQFEVLCSGYNAPGALATRTVDFYACATGTPASTCRSTPFASAEAVFDDVPPAGGPSSGSCLSSSSATCGISVTVTRWDLAPADS